MLHEIGQTQKNIVRFHLYEVPGVLRFKETELCLPGAEETGEWGIIV